MKDKICIVTGGSSGIGKATVAGLAQRGATVVIACRDIDKGRAALEEVAAKTGSNDLHVMPLDLASLGSVRAFAAAFTAKFTRLDVLVANAGVMTSKRQLTADGLEMNFGVNHVGHFLLTDLLLPLLKASAPSRVVVVSSNMHSRGKLDFDDLAMENGWGGSYPRSKLANMLFVRALAKRLAGTKVVVNGLHPGVISTELARDYAAPIRLMAKWFFKSPERGALTPMQQNRKRPTSRTETRHALGRIETANVSCSFGRATRIDRKRCAFRRRLRTRSRTSPSNGPPPGRSLSSAGRYG